MKRASWTAALLAAALAAIVGGLLVYRAMAYTRAFHEAEAASARATDVVETTDAVLIALLDAQRGLRGYLITRDEAFLDEWKRGEADLPPQLERLRQLSEGRAHTSQDVDALAERAERVMTFGRDALALARAGQWRVVEDRVRSGEGKRRMDDARALIDNLKGGAKFERDLRRRVADDMAEASIDAARGLVVFASGIAILLLLFGWLAMRRTKAGGGAARTGAGDMGDARPA